MSDTANNLLHILRNPHGWSDDAVRAVRLAAADEIERLRKELEYANLAAEAEARRGDALKAELDALKAQKPVAAVQIQKAGGNAGIAWHAVPTDDAPMMREGDLLYAAPKPGEGNE